MSNLIKILGAKKARAQLKQLAKDNHRRFGQALIAGGLLLQRFAQDETPVDTSALRNSAFTRAQHQRESLPEKTAAGESSSNYSSEQAAGLADAKKLRSSKNHGVDTEVIVGFTQNYAIYVHENLAARHPVGNAKFLEGPARRRKKEIMEMITHVAKTGKVT